MPSDWMRERLKGRDSEMMNEYDRIMRSIRMDMKEEFLEEGKTIGLQEGKAIGLEEGEAAVARKMIKASMPFESIANPMHLSREDIRMIAAEMTNGLCRLIG